MWVDHFHDLVLVDLDHCCRALMLVNPQHEFVFSQRRQGGGTHGSTVILMAVMFLSRCLLSAALTETERRTPISPSDIHKGQRVDRQAPSQGTACSDAVRSSSGAPAWR